MSDHQQAMEALASAAHPRASATSPIGPLPSLDELIPFLAETDPDAWWEGPTFRSPDGTRHCVLSHIHHHFGADAMTIFEEVWSTSYSIGRVNDGHHPGYPQADPKGRSIAYLYALRDGREDTTAESLERWASLPRAVES